MKEIGAKDSRPEVLTPAVQALRIFAGACHVDEPPPAVAHRGDAPCSPRPADGLAVDFVVESDRAQLSEIVQRVRDGRLRTNIGNVSTLDDAVAALNPTERINGKTIIRVRR
jgi:NADPH:quinone reductase-like Zn-dependent oxidoreductase